MIESTVVDDGLLCSFHAHLGAAECTAVEARLADTMDANPAKAIVFDMNGVEYISSAFLKICLLTAKASGDGRFRITNAAPAIRKVFKMANLEGALNVQ